MAVAELVAAPSLTGTLGTDPWERPAFGITLIGAPSARRAEGRWATWLHVSPRDVDAEWRDADGERLVDLRFPDGKAFLAVEHDDRLGYLVRAPRFGRHIVSPDGRVIRSALPRVAAWRWERLFLAQVLPLAAALQGLEVFHASAVTVSGRAVAFAGASGSGKTSTAAHLVASGAPFVTDDVLALEWTDDMVLAHPGPSRLAIDRRELLGIGHRERRRLGPLLGKSDKHYFAPTPVTAPLPLALLYFIRRVPSSDAFMINDVDEPRRLLGAPFLPYLRSPERLVTHLEICAQLARTARTFVIDVPPELGARQVGALAQEHARATLRAGAP